MLDIVQKIQLYEKNAEDKILAVQNQAQLIIKKCEEKAGQILLQAKELTEKEKKQIIEEIGQQTLKQLKNLERDTKIALSHLDEIESVKKQKTINLVIRQILND